MRSKSERRMIQKGLETIKNELEIDRFFKGQIMMKIAMKALFSKAERFLIRNNKKFLIDCERKNIRHSRNSDFAESSIEF